MKHHPISIYSTYPKFPTLWIFTNLLYSITHPPFLPSLYILLQQRCGGKRGREQEDRSQCRQTRPVCNKNYYLWFIYITPYTITVFTVLPSILLSIISYMSLSYMSLCYSCWQIMFHSHFDFLKTDYWMKRTQPSF